VLANADPNGMLVCRLLVSGIRLEINASVPLPAVGEPTVEPFSLRILRTLADTVDYWTSKSTGVRLFNVQLTTVLHAEPDE
jgi:hypothetical protein